MRAASIVIAFILLACGGPRPPGTERVENLGFGFRKITIGELNSFELGHHAYLYYRDRRLSAIGLACSVSPSGRFAAYQDGPSGKLLLFRRADQNVSELTPKFIAVAGRFVWHEDRGVVEVEFIDRHAPMTFPL